MEIVEMPLSESFEKKERKPALMVILKHLLSGGRAHGVLMIKCFFIC
ncbi:MAG: hypothetical protein ACLTBQ_04460 [Thomasclavelia sp.]|nr:hypothetical protein [Thomasclavelia sp.]